MDNQGVYSSGVYGAVQVCWQVRCETPLAVRNGISIEYQHHDQDKSRGVGLSFHWRQPGKEKSNTSQVSVLHYGYAVEDGRVIPYHFVPPSSVRGALRSWTINHLVHPAYRSKMSPPEKQNLEETETYLRNVRQALADPSSGYSLIASVFGLAFDTRAESEDVSSAGRLRVETIRFSHAQPQPIAVNGSLEGGTAGPGGLAGPDGLAGPGGMAGPTNAKRQMAVRNPLDRVTHASKEKGLHHFLEFCRGETFEIRLSVLNPQGSDLGLLSLWRRELHDGLLRLGALTSIGRGRVKIVAQTYDLWLGPGAPRFAWLDRFQPACGPASGEALEGLFKLYRLQPADLEAFAGELLAEAGGSA